MQVPFFAHNAVFEFSAAWNGHSIYSLKWPQAELSAPHNILFVKERILNSPALIPHTIDIRITNGVGHEWDCDVLWQNITEAEYSHMGGNLAICA